MMEHFRPGSRRLARAGRLGITFVVLASATVLLSACAGWSTPSVGASLACQNFQGREGGGADYLDCLREYRYLEHAGYGVSG